MGEKSLVLENLDLMEEVRNLKEMLSYRRELCETLGHKCDMWRAASEICDTRCKGLQLAVDQYREALKEIAENTTDSYSHTYARKALEER